MNSFLLGVASACLAFFGHWFIALPMLVLACYIAAYE